MLHNLNNYQNFLILKKKLHKQYVKATENINGLKIAPVPDYAENNHWLNLLQIEHSLYGRERDVIMDRMKEHGVQTRPVWQLKPFAEAI